MNNNIHRSTRHPGLHWEILTSYSASEKPLLAYGFVDDYGDLYLCRLMTVEVSS